ncbi:Gfo/Idh/MocA family protein [Nakamurella alba]|uniref:Gfo/Idh/MocA family protein n=1 Tax=Nakamurella alba TaxID=2665158 RepID=UPI0018AC2833|nr:Gfo/Idh/MocA family oxidoreductase [Nakamurella alba]
MTSLGVGVIGASPHGSWAARSHIPAIAAVPGLHLAAVCTSRSNSAREAAEAYGVPAFTDPNDLAGHPEVDLVVVAVNVPTHVDLVGAAVRAGRPVYCEWPLGVTTAQAVTIADSTGDLPTAVGLQARSAPALRHAAALLAEGAIGDLESVSATAFSSRGAHRVADGKRYLFDAATGANLLTIEGGHLLDALFLLCGEPVELTGRALVRRPEVADDTGRALTVSAPDTVTVAAALPGGAPLTAHLAQGSTALHRTEIVLLGSDGALTIRTTAPGGIQMAPLELHLARGRIAAPEPVTIPAGMTSTTAAVDLPATAVNVAEALAGFAAVLHGRQHPASPPDFGHAVTRHRSLDLVAPPAG